MAKDLTPKRVKTFRIEPDMDTQMQKVAKKIDRPESWVINQCLKLALPNLEKQQAKAA
jgi:predicted transcriptional regulator